MEVDENEHKQKIGFSKEFDDFCMSTTAHGFSNFTGDNKLKRRFWGMICLSKEAQYGLRTMCEATIIQNHVYQICY